jgi:ATP-dependent Lon protease
LVTIDFWGVNGYPVVPALLIVGDMSIQGNIKPLRALTEPLQVAKDNGARRALIPIENKRNFLDVSAEIMEQVDLIFYGTRRRPRPRYLGVHPTSFSNHRVESRRQARR